jgi:hypothetical protein
MKSIPWDVWAAGALAVSVLLLALFEPASAIFLVVYVVVCAYVAVKAFGSRRQ